MEYMHTGDEIHQAYGIQVTKENIISAGNKNLFVYNWFGTPNIVWLIFVLFGGLHCFGMKITDFSSKMNSLCINRTNYRLEPFP